MAAGCAARLTLLILWCWLATLGKCDSSVVELDEVNFEKVVSSSESIMVLVLFMAEWCTYCKAFEPEYAAVAESCALTGSQVLIAKVDVGQHRALGARLDITHYPTLRFFRGEVGEEYDGQRSTDSIVKWINARAGTSCQLKRESSAVVQLNGANFGQWREAANYVFIEFYAPWCSHCKQFSPVYESLARVFEGESSVLIAKVDATEEEGLAQQYGVTGFPTLIFLSKGDPLQDVYLGPRDLSSLVRHLNEKAGLDRTDSGGLGPHAGRIPALDAVVALPLHGAAMERLEVGYGGINPSFRCSSPPNHSNWLQSISQKAAQFTISRRRAKCWIIQVGKP
jgi:protein disulfide-isomerase A6